MKQQFQRCFRWVALLLIPVLIGSGCTRPDSTNSPSTPIQAHLETLETIVKRLRGDASVEVPKTERVEIQKDDRVSVEKDGRGLLIFSDRLRVEVFRETEIQLSEARLDPGESIFIRLIQTFGHTRTELNEEAQARVMLETDYATITALGEAEFVVCHAKELTCMVTTKGKAEVEAQGQVVTVEKGEATYIFPGEPPKPAICANIEEVNQWLDQKRGIGEIDPIGALVIGWPQEPCSAASLPPSALPSPEGMVKIEAGLYQVGSPQPDDFHISSQEITLAKFWIDQHEVTNAAYKQFLDQTGHLPPPNWLGGTFPSGRENHPIQGVTWGEAETYCIWANKRLPTEAEWEVAARGPGPEPPLYPWGPDPGAGGQIDNLPLTDTYAVTTQPFNKSPFDVYDLAGNVWEWVGEPYSPVADGHKVLRGGRHGLLKDMAYRQPAEPNNERFISVAGFRCAAERVEGEE
jgi:formylglycine-generating enzyme required for sulfatase activity